MAAVKSPADIPASGKLQPKPPLCRPLRQKSAGTEPRAPASLGTASAQPSRALGFSPVGSAEATGCPSGLLAVSTPVPKGGGDGAGGSRLGREPEGLKAASGRRHKCRAIPRSPAGRARPRSPLLPRPAGRPFLAAPSAAFHVGSPRRQLRRPRRLGRFCQVPTAALPRAKSPAASPGGRQKPRGRGRGHPDGTRNQGNGFPPEVVGVG